MKLKMSKIPGMLSRHRPLDDALFPAFYLVLNQQNKEFLIIVFIIIVITIIISVIIPRFNFLNRALMMITKRESVDR